MLRRTLLSWWAAPAPPRPKRSLFWDWAIVVVAVPIAIAEGVLREDLAGRSVVVVSAVAAIATLGLRRAHPLAAITIAFGTGIAASIAELLGLVELGDLRSTVVLLLLPYSLLRWGAGRALVLGLPLMVATYTFSLLAGELRETEDAIGGAVVLLLAATLGVTFRMRARARARELEHAKLREREQLARELHDTVAHHVSAILIQAQAARISASRTDTTLDAILAIEGEAARTLAELRAIVGALRSDGESAERAPQAGIRDIERLAAQHDVELELAGDIDALGPMLQAAVYRLAQESITNALRHAHNATRIVVRVAAGEDTVRLTVTDDGDPPRVPRSPSGFGLPGMAERAALLGGRFSAGPSSGRGWTVDAVLPRDGAR